MCMKSSGKGGVRTCFVAIFQVARNPLKFCMLTLFVLNNVSFFSRRQQNMNKIAQKSPSPLSLCVRQQQK